jgi:hypothetical protein
MNWWFWLTREVLLMGEELARSRRLIQSIQDEQLKEKILEVLPQGHGSGLDADLLDGLHAAEILAKARVGVPSGGGGGGGTTVINQAKNYFGAVSRDVWAIGVWFSALNDPNWTDTETSHQAPMSKGKFTKLKLYVASCNWDVGVTVTLRKNGLDTTLTIFIPGGTIDLILEDDREVEIADNDLVDLLINTAGNLSGTSITFVSLLEFQPS